MWVSHMITIKAYNLRMNDFHLGNFFPPSDHENYELYLVLRFVSLRVLNMIFKKNFPLQNKQNR